MDFLISLYNAVTSTMEVPGNFGWYHIVCIVSITLLTVIVARGFKNCSDRATRTLTAVVWLIILVLEIYKQLIHGFEIEDGKFVWDYAWYVFPFQFCSSPLYILPIIAFARSEKLRDACIAYMMTFSLFAGLAVLCYPNDVFIETIGINLQTMIHHGSQIIMGVFYAVRYRDRLDLRFYFNGFKVFVVMTSIAFTLNVVSHYAFAHFGIESSFNMFFISPYVECTLPVLSLFWGKLPYIGFLAVYFFGFVLAGLVVFSIENGLIIGSTKKCNQRAFSRIKKIKA